MNLKKISVSVYFLLIIILTYIILLIFDSKLFFSCLDFFFNILSNIIPILILVFVLMVFTNYFITQKFILKHMKKKGIKKWFFVIIGGILSTGPIYMWYPLLADLKNKGLNYGFIACFLYNRAVKIPLLPLMIFYFSFKYVMILALVMIFMSIFQGVIINKIMEVKK